MQQLWTNINGNGPNHRSRAVCAVPHGAAPVLRPCPNVPARRRRRWAAAGSGGLRGGRLGRLDGDGLQVLTAVVSAAVYTVQAESSKGEMEAVGEEQEGQEDEGGEEDEGVEEDEEGVRRTSRTRMARMTGGRGGGRGGTAHAASSLGICASGATRQWYVIQS